MDISALTGSNLKFDIILASQPFYGQYRFMARFSTQGLGCLRQIEPDLDRYLASVAQKFEYRQRGGRAPSVWRTRRLNSSWLPDHSNLAKNAFKHTALIQQYQNLLDLATTIHSLLPNIKLVAVGDTGYLYTNQPDSLYFLQTKSYLSNLAYREVNIALPPNVINLQQSDYNYRTFFRNRYLTPERKQSVASVLVNNREHIRLSPSLSRWVDGKLSSYRNNWLETYYFFDHVSTHEPMMLNLACPGIIRQTLPIHVVNN